MIETTSIAIGECKRDEVSNKGNQRLDKERLGQVFTPEDLTIFMLNLFKNQIKQQSKILDPCIGPNTFFKELAKYSENLNLTGVEIDKTLITEDIKSFYKPENRILVAGSFFDFPVKNKFDFIIQNPPYVRQELLERKEGVAQKSIQESFKDIKIPLKSNLYVYFLLKSILHLKEGGVMVAVIYDSWLFSQYGQFLKESLINFGQLKQIYHFRKNAFPDIEVGATVIYFVKQKKKVEDIKYTCLMDVNETKDTSLLSINQQLLTVEEFTKYKFNGRTSLEFKNPFFVPLKELSILPIQRGTSAIINNYFIHKTPKFKEQIPFIKDVTKIPTFVVKKETSYLLAADEYSSQEVFEYLEEVKNEILKNTDKFVSVKRNINAGKPWYKIKVKTTGNFIFNYYMRKNIDFIYNKSGYVVSDNFYILNINKNPLAHLAILNSSFTRLAILQYSRNQGNGLKKIQAYEFKEVPVVDLGKLSDKVIDNLSKLGKKLQKINRYNYEVTEKLLTSVDEILLQEYNLATNSQISINQINEDLSFYFN